MWFIQDGNTSIHFRFIQLCISPLIIYVQEITLEASKRSESGKGSTLSDLYVMIQRILADVWTQSNDTFP